jgi:uncharacterized membrane protein YbhN (UPF0104 family)
MKRFVWPVLQFLFGVGLVAALLWRVHNGRSTVEGVAEEGCSVETGAVYRATADSKVAVTVERYAAESRRVQCACALPPERAVAVCGDLVRRIGGTTQRIGLKELSARPAGLSALGSVLAVGVGNWLWLLVSFLAAVCTVVLCSWRWLVLLRAQEVHIGRRRAGELYLVGAFFSLLLPGATAGDLVKGWYVAREATGRRAEAATTVLLDRIMGFVGLIMVAAVVLVWQWPRFGAEPGFLAAAVGVALAAAAIGALVPVALSRRSFPDGRIGRILARVREAVRVALADRRALALAVLLSLGNHAAFLASEYAAVVAVGASLRPGEAVAGFMLVNVVAAMPVTPGGLGSREAACLVVLGWFGVAGESALAVSLLVYLWLVTIGMAGAVVWILDRPRRKGAQILA